MLKPPHIHYSRLYTYHIDGTGLPTPADPDLIGSWEEDGKTVIVFHTARDGLVENLCRHSGLKLFYRAELDYNEWEMGREIVPFTVGPLTVAPIWDPAPASIRIDPSVVFGSGFHPSTRLCLESLVNFHARLPEHFTALDLGCGTGLLAVGAARLGAAAVMAVDHNSLACAVTRQNASYNSVESRIQVRQVDLRKKLPSTRADLLIANLHHELLATLFENPSFWQARLFILSGFMPGEEETLLAALPDQPPPFLARRLLEKWCVWVLGKV
jgi:ribosomal protein L11 methyltransferase